MRLSDHHDRIRVGLESGESIRSIARGIGCNHSSIVGYRDRYLSDVKRIPAGVGAQGLGDGAVSREEVLEDQLRELTRERRKGRKAEVAEERILTAIEEALAAVTEQQLHPRIIVPPVPFEDLYACDENDKVKWGTPPGAWGEPSPGAHHRQAVLLSDFHGGEVVDPDGVNDLNAYNWAIQEQRVDEVVESLLSYKRRAPELTGLDVAFLGDMCSGSNHAELAETNEYNAAEQGVKMGYLLGQLVERLVPHYPEIKVLGVVGNHPRTSIKPAAKNVWSSFDWVAYKVAEQYLASYNTVTCNFPRSGALIHTIAGLNYYVFHGDGIRSTMPGVPWGGVMRRVNNIRASHPNTKIDGFWLGHFHQANSMLDLQIHMNGALKGTDEWVLKNFGGGAPPRQLLLTFDEKAQRFVGTQSIDPTAGLPA